MPYDPSSFTGAANLPVIGAPAMRNLPGQLHQAFADAIAERQMRVQEEESPFKQALQQAQAQKAARPDVSSLEEAMAAQHRLASQYPEGSQERELAQAFVNKAAYGTQGTTVFDPNTGQPIVQMGGGGKPGGAFQVDGQTFVKPGKTTETALEKTILTGDVLDKKLGNIIENVSPFLGAQGEAKLKAAQFGGYLGAPGAETASKYAEGQADLNAVVEHIISATGLPKTNESSAMVLEMVQPQTGENAKTYSARMKKMQKELKQRATAAKKSLMGIDVTQTNNQNQQLADRLGIR